MSLRSLLTAPRTSLILLGVIVTATAIIVSASPSMARTAEKPQAAPVAVERIVASSSTVQAKSFDTEPRADRTTTAHTADKPQAIIVRDKRAAASSSTVQAKPGETEPMVTSDPVKPLWMHRVENFLVKGPGLMGNLALGKITIFHFPNGVVISPEVLNFVARDPSRCQLIVVETSPADIIPPTLHYEFGLFAYQSPGSRFIKKLMNIDDATPRTGVLDTQGKILEDTLFLKGRDDVSKKTIEELFTNGVIDYQRIRAHRLADLTARFQNTGGWKVFIKWQEPLAEGHSEVTDRAAKDDIRNFLSTCARRGAWDDISQFFILLGVGNITNGNRAYSFWKISSETIPAIAREVHDIDGLLAYVSNEINSTTPETERSFFRGLLGELAATTHQKNVAAAYWQSMGPAEKLYGQDFDTFVPLLMRGDVKANQYIEAILNDNLGYRNSLLYALEPSIAAKLPQALALQESIMNFKPRPTVAEPITETVTPTNPNF